MIEVYITDVRQWNEEAVYREWLNRLPAERKTRAENCRHAADKRRSLAGSLLVQYAFARWQTLAYEASAPDFSYGSDGRPYFPDYPQFHFSISHSGDYAVCAVSDREVGVDIQEIRPVKASIAERFFTEAERAQMERVTGDEEIRMLFRIWSAKESYVKLTGRGMAEGLRTFTADMENGRILHGNTVCTEKEKQCPDTECTEETAFHTGAAEDVYLKEYKAPDGYVLTACGYGQEFRGGYTYEI